MKGYCAWLARCLPPLPGDSQARCEAYAAPFCDWSGLPGVVAGDADLAACGSVYADLSCTDYVACTYTPGTLENGSSCGTGRQCESGYCTSEAGSCGQCTDPPAPAQAGDPCDSDIYDCQYAFDCIDHRCAPRGGVGDPCGDEHTCDPALRYDGYLACLDGQCTLVGQDGEPCFAEYGLLRCGGRSDCTASSSCAPYELVENGEQCGTFVDRVVHCKDGGCVTDPDDPDIQRCFAFAGEGEDCTQLPGYHRCQGGMQCDSVTNLCGWPPPLVPATSCNP